MFFRYWLAPAMSLSGASGWAGSVQKMTTCENMQPDFVERCVTSKGILTWESKEAQPCGCACRNQLASLYLLRRRTKAPNPANKKSARDEGSGTGVTSEKILLIKMSSTKTAAALPP